MAQTGEEADQTRRQEERQTAHYQHDNRTILPAPHWPVHLSEQFKRDYPQLVIKAILADSAYRASPFPEGHPENRREDTGFKPDALEPKSSISPRKRTGRPRLLSAQEVAISNG